MAKIPGMKKVQQLRSLSALWKHRAQLFRMMGDMIRGHYRASFLTLAALVGAALYLFSPFNLMTDMVPVVGWVDDGFIFYFLLKRLMTELQRYEAWKNPLKLVSK